MTNLTHERLLALLTYDPLSGVFTARVARRGVAVGKVLGSRQKSGYLLISLDGVRYYAHRLAWFYIHGAWPALLADHRDRVRHHNAIDNIRDATATLNAQNTDGALPGKTTNAPRGVSYNSTESRKKRWCAQIQASGKTYRLGRFETAAEAARAYENKRQELHAAALEAR